MTTPVLVQTATASATSPTAVTATFSSPNTNGNFLIAFCQVSAAGNSFSVSDPTNGKYLKLVSGSSGTNTVAIYITPVPTPSVNNSGQGVTVTMSVGSGSGSVERLIIHEWSGLDATNPYFLLDKTLAAASGTSTAPSAGVFSTLAESGELVLAWGSTHDTSTTWTAGSGWTLDGSTNPAGRQVQYQVVSGTTGPDTAFSISASLAWTATAVALRSAKTRKVISITSGTTFSAPSDWPGIADRVDVFGGGGAGITGNAATAQAPGGGGGAYTFDYNIVIANGASMQIGAGGATSGASGTDTWIVSSGTILAKGGGGAGTGTSGTGGAAGSCIPAANAQSGGDGGSRGSANANSGGVGGGGAGGPYGSGANGGTQISAAGATGGTGGGGGGGGTNGTTQTNQQAGTAGGNAGGPAGVNSGTGGTGGASGTNAGSAGTGVTFNSGAGGGGGGSDGAGGGGAGGAGSNGGECSLTAGGFVGGGGGGGGAGNVTSGSVNGGAGGNYGGGGGGGGNGNNNGFGAGAGGLIVLTYTTGGLGPQTITSAEGNLGEGVSYSTTAQTGSFVEGAPTVSEDLFLSGQTATFGEGVVLIGAVLAGQTITSSEGTITASIAGNVTLAISAQTAGFSEGTLFDNIGYLLDQSGVILVGQTAYFQEGFLGLERDASLTAQTIASSEGTVSPNVSIGLTGQTIVSAEGFIVAQAGSNQNLTLGNLFINSVLGVPTVQVSYSPPAYTIALTEGTITFSSQLGSFLLGAQTINVIEGVIPFQPPSPGTGPPLFIPPQLGKPVTTRTFSWLDMAQRAWGSEFRAPDHRIYQFSGGNYKDSTDMGTTGIYSPNLGTPDNPPPKT